MSLKLQNSRQILKRVTTSGSTPTIGPSSDHTDGTWTVDDIYCGEFYWNMADKTLWLGYCSTGGTGTELIYPPSGTTSFTGGSGNCISQLYVTDIFGCSPITINDDTKLIYDKLILDPLSGQSISMGTTSSPGSLVLQARDTASPFDRSRLTMQNNQLFFQTLEFGGGKELSMYQQHNIFQGEFAATNNIIQRKDALLVDMSGSTFNTGIYSRSIATGERSRLYFLDPTSSKWEWRNSTGTNTNWIALSGGNMYHRAITATNSSEIDVEPTEIIHRSPKFERNFNSLSNTLRDYSETAKVTTTDGTPTTIFSLPAAPLNATNGIVFIKAKVYGETATYFRVYMGEIENVWKYVNTTVTTIGVDAKNEYTQYTSATCRFNNVAGVISLQVIGEAATTINWQVEFTYYIKNS
jgi:hypothetical protein